MFSKLRFGQIALTLSTGTLVHAGGLGQWGPVIEFPLVPVAAALLPATGELLVWSSWADNHFQPVAIGQTVTAIYNPTNGAVSEATITTTHHDMFCPGISTDFTGRIIVTGGDNAQTTSIFDDAANNWKNGSTMNIARGYHASTTTSDGRMFVIGGSFSGGLGGKNGEIYDPKTNTWTLLPGCPVAPLLTADAGGLFRTDNHAWLFSWKNGNVFQAGPSKAMNWYGTSGGGSHKAAGLRGTDTDSMTGVAVMYDATKGQILTAGGSTDYTGSPATVNVHKITLGNPGDVPNVQTLSPMTYARMYANAVILPNGHVFVTGGLPHGDIYSDNNAQLTPEIWDPDTNKFTCMTPNKISRNYHSVAILMPDASVFTGGGGLCGSCNVNHPDGQFYYPPSLYLADGKTLAPRPVISKLSATTLRLGDKLTVTMLHDVKSFSLIRMSTVTHSLNTDQRRIPLVPTVNGLQFTVHVPSDSGVALPGYYMLFAIDAAGVPSVAKTVLVTL